ncbi:MAG: LysM peptidoglycan-binding domain-containing protein [Acidobacteria bacterium]|nr:LysM peptidoglycan-binding domain-containing protein [Acidobacteriota bacterium]
MRRSSSAIGVVVFSIFCLLGCAAGHPAPLSAPAAPAPAPLSGGAASHDEGPAPEGAPPHPAPVLIDQISVVIQESNDKYLMGEEAYRAGDLERARSHFDAALLTFMTSGLDVLNEPRLREAYDRMARDIQSLEAEALASPDGEAKPDASDVPADELKDIKQFLTPEELASEMRKVKPLAAGDSFSIPVVLNDRVLTLVQAWQTHFTKAFAGGYERMGRYEPMIRRVLREEGLPEDLIYLAFTESTFKPSAYSRARARGIWQFMASTGSRYGLTKNSYVDERSDPEKATRAAAQYLKELYGMFGDWNLVLASYNCGEGLVQKAMARTGKTDYWDLMTTRYFRNETKNFVPSIMALSLMSRDPSAYGFDAIEKDAPLEFDRVTVDGPADLSLVARLSGTTPEAIKELNPELTRAVTPPGLKSYSLRVPKGSGESFQTAYASLAPSDKIANVRLIAASSGRRRGGRASAADVEAGDDGRYTVQSGDTLSDIARQFGMSVRSLTSANGITEKSLLFPGQSLKVRMASSTAASKSARVAPAPAPLAGHHGSTSSRAKTASAEKDAAQKLSYKVRPGDNLYRIAQRYGASVDDLRSWNGLKKSGDIFPGDMLTIYAR